MLKDSGLKRDTVAAITTLAGPTIIVPVLMLIFYQLKQKTSSADSRMNALNNTALAVKPRRYPDHEIGELHIDDYVKFWAMQSLVTSVIMFIIFWGIGIFAFSLFLAKIIAGINGLFMLTGFVLWLVFVYKSWMGERWVAPIVGPIAEKLLKKLK